MLISWSGILKNRATPFPQHHKQVNSITVTLTLKKNGFYTQPLLKAMTWTQAALATDPQPINLHCGILVTHVSGYSSSLAEK